MLGTLGVKSSQGVMAVVAFPLCMDVVEVIVVRMVQILNKR